MSVYAHVVKKVIGKVVLDWITSSKSSSQSHVTWSLSFLASSVNMSAYDEELAVQKQNLMQPLLDEYLPDLVRYDEPDLSLKVELILKFTTVGEQCRLQRVHKAKAAGTCDAALQNMVTHVTQIYADLEKWDLLNTECQSGNLKSDLMVTLAGMPALMSYRNFDTDGFYAKRFSLIQETLGQLQGCEVDDIEGINNCVDEFIATLKRIEGDKSKSSSEAAQFIMELIGETKDRLKHSTSYEFKMPQ